MLRGDEEKTVMIEFWGMQGPGLDHGEIVGVAA